MSLIIAAGQEVQAEELLQRHVAQRACARVAVEVRPIGELVERVWSLDARGTSSNSTNLTSMPMKPRVPRGRGDGGEDVKRRVVAGEALVAPPGRGLEVDGLELRDEVGEERAEQLATESERSSFARPNRLKVRGCDESRFPHRRSSSMNAPYSR